MFQTVPLSIIRSYSLYTQQWYMSYRQLSSRIRMECSSILILLESCLQTCMTYTIPECTENNSWRWIEELSETCGVSFQNKFEKLVHLVGFIIRKFVTMHGHMNVKNRGDTYWYITYLEARDTTYESVAYKVCDVLVLWFAERTYPSACPKIMRPSLSHIKQVTADCWGNLLHITFFSPLYVDKLQLCVI
jgi:hypothetical protein